MCLRLPKERAILLDALFHTLRPYLLAHPVKDIVLYLFNFFDGLLIMETLIEAHLHLVFLEVLTVTLLNDPALRFYH